MNQHIDLLAFSFSHTQILPHSLSRSLSVCCICMDRSQLLLRIPITTGPGEGAKREKRGYSEGLRKKRKQSCRGRREGGCCRTRRLVLTWWPAAKADSGLMGGGGGEGGGGYSDAAAPCEEGKSNTYILML